MNSYKALRGLLSDPPLEVGEVVASLAGDSWLIELPGGGQIQARGQATVGQEVFVRNGLIEGQAPALTVVLIDI
jgi:hypothetical protein